MDPLVSTLTFVAFDFETTGYSPDSDEIVELGAVRFSLDRVDATFQQLVKPSSALSERVMAVHGITNAAVADAPSVAEVLPSFLEFIDTHVLIAHNVAFDLGFLREAVQKFSPNNAVNNLILDTLTIARMAFPRLPSYSLQSLVQQFKFPVREAHRALDDALSCRDLFLLAVEEMGFFGNLHLSELQSI